MIYLPVSWVSNSTAIESIWQQSELKTAATKANSKSTPQLWVFSLSFSWRASHHLQQSSLQEDSLFGPVTPPTSQQHGGKLKTAEAWDSLPNVQP
jgi:hypothetical protein